MILVFRDAQRTPVSRNRIGQQLAQSVLGPQVEVVGGERRLRRQFGIREICGADLSGRCAALYLSADAAPDVQVPRDGSAETVLRAATSAAASRGTRRKRRNLAIGAAAAVSRDTWTESDCGKQTGACL